MRRFLNGVEALAGASLAGLALLVVFQVAGRYLFASAPSWTEELARYLQVWMVFLAAPVCLDRGMHLAVDYLTPRLSPARRAAVRRVVLGFIGVWALAMTAASLALLRIAALQTSPALGVSMVWPYLAVPSGSALLAAVAASRIVGMAEGGDDA